MGTLYYAGRKTELGQTLLFFCSLFLLYDTRLTAQQPRVESLTIADGLSQGMIYDIEQTDDGFLWFATKDGLNRYDGYNFRVYMHDPFNPFSIAGNDVIALFKDSRGNLWLSVAGKGLDILEKNSGKFLHLAVLAGERNFSENFSLVETPDGTIWAGSPDGLFRLRWKNPGHVYTDNPNLEASLTVECVSRGKQPDKKHFTAISANTDGTLTTYIRADGIYKFTPADGTLNLILPVPEDDLYVGDALGSLWAIRNNRLCIVENGRSPRETWIGKFIHSARGDIMCSDSRGALYFSTKENDYFGFYNITKADIYGKEPGKQRRRIYTLQEGYPTAMKVDDSDNLWIGTSGYGLLKVNLSSQPFHHFLKGTSIGPIRFNQAGYLPSLYGGKIFKFDEASGQLIPDGISTESLVIFNVFQAKNGVTYYGAYSREIQSPYYLGIQKDSEIEWSAIAKGMDRKDLFCPFLEDWKGNIWTGEGENGLICYQPATKSITFFDVSKMLGIKTFFYALYEDALHNLWVGTAHGIVRFEIPDIGIRSDNKSIVIDTKARSYQTDPANPHSLRNNFVTSFCPDPLDPERYLWVSTKGGGLNLLDKNTGEFRHFTSENSGLPNNVVYGILPDEQGNLWMSTNRGLSRLTIDGRRWTVDGGGSYRFRNFRDYDGLQGDEFNTGSFARCPDGRLLFGGVNGLTAFYPSEVADRKSDARTLITALKINNLPVDVFHKNSPLSRPIHMTDHLHIDYDKNNVTFEFALMDFVTPEENRYRYRLQGADPDWVDAGKSHDANYTRLPPGTYTFEVQGCIAGGEWSAPTVLHITVLPPWWRTWWAYVSYALAFVCLILFIRKYELNRIAVREEARHIKELDNAKTRLYTNITHEFRTPLTVIMGMADNISGHEQERRLIRRNSRKLLQLITQMLDLSKIESGAMKLRLRQADIIPYLRYLTESFHSMAKEKEIQLVFYSEEPELMMDFDEEKIQHVVYNLLSNALKFTPKGGKIVLHTRLADHHLQLNVQDSGMGIAPENLPHIFDRFYQADTSHTRKGEGTGIGLALTKEFVELMGGTISVASAPGAGSTFTLLLPVKNEALLAAPELPTVVPPRPEPPGEAATAREEPAAGPGGDKPLLLIVEDNPDVTAYVRTLVQRDYQLLTAPDGKAGLETALERIPDIIISDVMMPEMDGYELTQTLKADERTSHIPVILLTAKAEEQDRIAGLRQGADAYLVKPFNKEELLVRLEKLTDLRRRLQQRYSHLTVATPPEADTAPSHPAEDAFLQKLLAIVEARIDDPDFGTTELCKAALLSQPQLHRKLSALTGKSPTLFIRAVRLRKAAELLRTGTMNVSEVAWAAGFNDPGYFSRVFQEEFGKTPKEWRG